MIDRKSFFDAARARPFGGTLTQGQVDGINAILDAWESRPEFTDPRWLAYMLATAKHETANTMQPIGEYGGNAYFHRMYDPDGERGDFARRNGNTEPGDGVRFHGRGYVQLTWRSNYAKMAALTGVDLVGNPELALDPKIASLILFEGMKSGMFTGVGLGTYFNQVKDDPVNARRIINGTDRAYDIAEIHRDFLAAITAATASNTAGSCTAAPAWD